MKEMRIADWLGHSHQRWYWTLLVVLFF